MRRSSLARGLAKAVAGMIGSKDHRQKVRVAVTGCFDSRRGLQAMANSGAMAATNRPARSASSQEARSDQ